MSHFKGNKEKEILQVARYFDFLHRTEWTSATDIAGLIALELGWSHMLAVADPTRFLA